MLYAGHVVADIEDSLPTGSRAFHAAHALFLERRVSNGEYLIHDQDVRFEVSSNREGEAQVHAAGVALDRRVYELVHFRESHDLIEFTHDFAPTHSENSAIQIDILSPGQFRMEAGADLQQARHPPADLDAPGRRLGDPGENLQEGAL